MSSATGRWNSTRLGRVSQQARAGNKTVGVSLSGNETEDPRRRYETALRCWEQAFRNERLTPEEKRGLIATGHRAIDDALAADATNVNALVCRILLLELELTISHDARETDALSEEVARVREQVRGARFTGGEDNRS
jgi:hypothetical protein